MGTYGPDHPGCPYYLIGLPTKQGPFIKVVVHACFAREEYIYTSIFKTDRAPRADSGHFSLFRGSAQSIQFSPGGSGNVLRCDCFKNIYYYT